MQKYEAIIVEIDKAKTKYEECLKSCRELSAIYAEAVREARQVKRDLTEQMEKEITNFRKYSRILLNDTK